MTATDAPGSTPATEQADAGAAAIAAAEAQAPQQGDAADAARSSAATNGNDVKSSQVVSFCLGEEEYGVDIMTVQEIILYGCITQVPEVPEHVLGVINLRGNVIPILNLRRRFGMPDQAPEDATRIVVMNLNGRTVGVVVDGVNEVLRLGEDEVSPTPQSLCPHPYHYPLQAQSRCHARPRDSIGAPAQRPHQAGWVKSPKIPRYLLPLRRESAAIR